MGVVYPCFCTRKQIRMEVEQSGRAPHGPNAELVYPGICRDIAPLESGRRLDKGEPFALRLDVRKALALTGPLAWYDCRAGWIEAEPRSGDPSSPARERRQLSSGRRARRITSRASISSPWRDLFSRDPRPPAAPGTPRDRSAAHYHHNLVADSRGERLAKRNRAITLSICAISAVRHADIWTMIGLKQALLIAGPRCRIRTTAGPSGAAFPHRSSSASSPPAALVLHPLDDRTSPGSSTRPRASPGPSSWLCTASTTTAAPFDDFAAFATSQGYLVEAFDQQGFGANRNRGLWPGAEALVRRPRRRAGELRAEWPGTPLFVLGESMGGRPSPRVAFAGRSGADGEPLIDGLVLAAPASGAVPP
jgi:hypothetical protein